jgi:hypothetical protein
MSEEQIKDVHELLQLTYLRAVVVALVVNPRSARRLFIVESADRGKRTT